MAVKLLLFSLLVLFPEVQPFEWDPNSAADGQGYFVCKDSTVVIPWLYLVSPSETVNQISWMFKGRSEEIVAIYLHGHLQVMPTFSGRFQASGNFSSPQQLKEHNGTQDAGIQLLNVTVGDTGNFTVEIEVFEGQGNSHVAKTIRRSVVVDVSDQLMTTNGTLKAIQGSEAVFDPSTHQMSIQLRCGPFKFPADPTFQVEWTTPDGQKVNSSNFEDHYFNLILPNPVPAGGNFTCTIPHEHYGDVCLTTQTPGQATVLVDRVEARLSLLEKENSLLKQHLNLTSTSICTDCELKVIQDELSRTKVDLSKVKDELSAIKSQVSLTNTSGTQAVSDRVQKLEDAARHQVAFHATHLKEIRPADGTPLVFSDTVLNLGEAYDNTTGKFQAPGPGVYFFIASTAGADNNSRALFDLCVDTWAIATGFSFFDGTSMHAQFSSAHGAIHLDAGQSVWVRGYGNTYAGGNHTLFTGFLLYHDFV